MPNLISTDRLRELAAKIWYNAQTYAEVLHELEALLKEIEQELKQQKSRKRG